MKTIPEQTKAPVNEHCFKTRWLRYGLVVLSIMQAHWPTLVVGAATVTAATLFGDKGYLSLISEDVATLVADDKPGETIDFLEKKIEEYRQWSNDYPDKSLRNTTALPYLRYQLAKALEAAGTDFDEIVATYKTAVSFERIYGTEKHVVAALLWLYENTSEKEYVETIQNNLKGKNDDMRNVAMAFEAARHWSAFELFLDSAVSEVDDSLRWVDSINHGLKNEVWQEKFLEYARSKPMLTEYFFQKYGEDAQNHLEQEDYRKAVEIYREIVGLCGPNQDKAIYEYKVCQTLFLDGQYEEGVGELERFIDENHSTHRHLTQQAILLKGRTLVHLGRIDRAIDTFLKLMVEYPEAKQAPEANFFMGYSYMLQGKFELADESLTLVVENYPKSSYAGKARLCLIRIKSMGQ